MQLFFSDAVGSWVWWAFNGESALGEGLVYGGTLATGNTGNQALRGICVSRFTEGNKDSMKRLEVCVLISLWSGATVLYRSLVLCVLNLLSLEMASLRLVGVGEDEVGLKSSAGETFEGLVVANSSTN